MKKKAEPIEPIVEPIEPTEIPESVKDDKVPEGKKKVEYMTKDGHLVSFVMDQAAVDRKKFIRKNISKRLQAIFSLYAPNELINVARELTGGGFISSYSEDPEMLEVENKPALGISVFDLIVSAQIAKACKGDPRAAKLLLEYGFGKPEQKLILSEEGEEKIPMSTEDKLKFLEVWSRMKKSKEE